MRTAYVLEKLQYKVHCHRHNPTYKHQFNLVGHGRWQEVPPPTLWHTHCMHRHWDTTAPEPPTLMPWRATPPSQSSSVSPPRSPPLPLSLDSSCSRTDLCIPCNRSAPIRSTWTYTVAIGIVRLRMKVQVLCVIGCYLPAVSHIQDAAHTSTFQANKVVCTNRSACWWCHIGDDHT